MPLREKREEINLLLFSHIPPPYKPEELLKKAKQREIVFLLHRFLETHFISETQIT